MTEPQVPAEEPADEEAVAVGEDHEEHHDSRGALVMTLILLVLVIVAWVWAYGELITRA